MTRNPTLYCILKAESDKLNGKQSQPIVQECPRRLKSCVDCWTAVRKRHLKQMDLKND